MTSYRDRQRAAARARLERGMAERAEQAQRRKQIRRIAAGSAAFLVIVGAGVLVTVLATGGKKHTAKPAATEAPCAYQAVPNPSASPSPEVVPSEIEKVGTPPASSVVHSGVQLMTLTTTQGTIRIQVDTAKAPCTAASFTYLAQKKFFDNSKCHRMATSGIFILQCGDPSATGLGGPDYRIPDENLPTSKSPAYPEGSVAMANAGANTNGSQFFIVYQDSDLPASYTVIGHVLQGLDVVKRVATAGVIDTDPSNPGVGAPKVEVKILSMTLDAPAASLPKLPPVSAAPAVSTSGSGSPVPASSSAKTP